MPTNFPSWGHGREGLESHFREKLQIPYFWSRVWAPTNGLHLVWWNAVAHHFCLNLPRVFWQPGKHSFGDPCTWSPIPQYLIATHFSNDLNGIIHDFSLLIPREFSADVLLDANSWWVTGGTGYGGVLATTGKTFRMNPRLRD